MKKVFAAISLMMILMATNSFAGLLLSDGASTQGSQCARNEGVVLNDGVIVAGLTGVIVAGLTGVIVAGFASDSVPCSETEGVIVAG
jgi:hypothetical protein